MHATHISGSMTHSSHQTPKYLRLEAIAYGRIYAAIVAGAEPVSIVFDAFDTPPELAFDWGVGLRECGTAILQIHPYRSLGSCQITASPLPDERVRLTADRFLSGSQRTRELDGIVERQILIREIGRFLHDIATSPHFAAGWLYSDLVPDAWHVEADAQWAQTLADGVYSDEDEWEEHRFASQYATERLTLDSEHLDRLERARNEFLEMAQALS